MPLRLFDQKFRRQPGKYFLQAGFAVCVIALLMSFHPFVESPVLLAALGASTFVAFTLPHMPLSNTRHLVGGYLVGAAVGGVCQTLLLAGVLESMGIPHDAGRTLLAGVGVGVSMLAMVVLDMEHAPAASITLGLILDHPVPANIVYVVAGIIVLATVKRLLKPVMIDLL